MKMAAAAPLGPSVPSGTLARLVLLAPCLLAALLSPVALASASASDPAPAGHDPSLVPLVEWFVARRGAYYNPKQEIRHETPGDPTTILGVFANDRIEKGELLISVPWNATINAGYRVRSPPHMVCDTVRNLAREMRLGKDSEFAPYVEYLLKQRRGQLPSAWSDAGKDLLRSILDGDALPPADGGDPLDLLTYDWHVTCDGKRDPLDDNAAMLVIQRAEDDLMLPVYDMYNHRNGPYLNTLNDRQNQKKFDVSASKTIERGEQIYLSYNMCSNCGNRADSFGTPEMFRDYGFVEMMPQRWIFDEQLCSFDLQEKKSDPSTVKLKWMKDGKPKRRAQKQRAVQSFRRHIVRIGKLKSMEQQGRNGQISSGGGDGEPTVVPQYEWDRAWQYADAMVVAMRLAVDVLVDDLGEHAEQVCAPPPRGGGVGEEEDDGTAAGTGTGTCSVSSDYDALDDEPDHLFYKNVPGGYRGGITKTCKNAKLMKFKGRTILEETASLYQELLYWIMPDGDVCLQLDGIVQTCAKYRPHYHELVVDFPARYIDTVRRILFVGGGDSMILAEAMKYPDLELVVGLELDQKVVRKTFKYFHTQPYFHDERVEWWFGDAIKSLRMLPRDYFGTFDLVLVDLSETVASFEVTTKLDMMEALALLLKPGGVMIKNEWEYLDKMSTIFDYTARLYMQDVPTICDQAVTMGSNRVDFFRHAPKNHDVLKRLLLDDEGVDDQYFMFHDYQKNNARAQGRCDESEEPVEEATEHAGVLMLVDAENTSTPLQPMEKVANAIVEAVQAVGLSPLSTVAPSSKDDGVAAVILMSEGYVTARAWPDQKYCAFDMYLWSAFDKMNALKSSLVKAVGSGPGSWSSYRIVAGGMQGTSTWSMDQKMVGPRFVQTRNCADASSDTEGGSFSDPGAMNTVLEESMSLVQSKESPVLVVCGLHGEPCDSLDVLAKDGTVREAITLWTCPTIKEGFEYTENGDSSMVDCERDSLNLLTEAVAGKAKIGALVMDSSTPVAMVKIVNSIFSSKINRIRLLEDHVVFMAMMANETEIWRNKHNFLDRIRKEIKGDPLFTAELLVNSSDGRMELGILSSQDEDFFPRLYNVTRNIDTQPGLDVEVRKILGGRWKKQTHYSPREYSPDDYDLLPGREQFLQQKPMGRQSLFQLECKGKGDEISRIDIESALFYAFSEMKVQVEEMKAVANLGDGLVIVAILAEGSTIVVWDGNVHVDINLFTYDESEEMTKKFIDGYLGRVSQLKMIQRDEQPRGTGRVVNFLSDVSAIQGRAAEEKALYKCPSKELEKGINEVKGYFDYYDKDNKRHRKKSAKDDNYYTKGFRDVKFGGRSQTYTEMKERATKYISKAFGDNLKSGDKIYESACGEGFNILMTLEILKEERGIKNLSAFGNEYLADSTAVANALFDKQSSTREWIKKGKFCQGDSTNLDFVPSATFDLAFTYIDPLVDPLRRHEEDMAFQDRVKITKKLCKSEEKTDQEIVAKDQAAQDDWHSSWVKELIRIVKPGKVVIIEDVDLPLCEESSDWGGVSFEWWKEAVSKYGWDVDPDSIEITDKAWYKNRYNVLMRRNTKDSKQ